MNAIDLNILISNGGTIKKYAKGDFVFEEGRVAKYYYQVIKGKVKIFCTNADGKELIQSVFKIGEGFGEPPLFLNCTYPSSAEAIESCEIIRISKEKFLEIICKNPAIAILFLEIFSKRIYAKTTNSQILISRTPDEKILIFLEKHKQSSELNIQQLVPFTRQQIADMTGLRVETVIRTIKKLCKQNKLQIINRKIYY